MAPRSPGLVYLDSSALVKLIAVEPETSALRREFARWPARTTSALATVEVARTARRLGQGAPALVPRLLAGLRLLAFEPILPAATQIGGPMLRSLDAVHLATAASIANELGAVITYDQRWPPRHVARSQWARSGLASPLGTVDLRQECRSAR